MLLDKLTILRLVKKFVDPECLLSCSQDSTLCSYPQPDQSIPRRLKTHFNIALSSRLMSCKFFFVSGLLTETHPPVLPTCYITRQSNPLCCYLHEIEIRMKVVINLFKHFVFSLRKVMINYFVCGKMAPQLTTSRTQQEVLRWEERERDGFYNLERRP